ncbi:MAG: hypothetical protein M5R40_00275 [Anaerolineae bacterium]|nr:hypothetical protein [Anaerolineae bacterium]
MKYVWLPLLAGDHQDSAAPEEHGADSGNQGGDTELHHDHAVQEPDQEADEQAGDQRKHDAFRRHEDQS